MLKLLLAAAAFCICMAAGRVAAEKYKLRQKTLCGFLSDLKVLEAALKYERTDVKSLALLLAARGSLREFWRIMSDELTNGAGFGEAWRRHRRELMLNEDVGAIADGFAEHFGSNDAETELSCQKRKKHSVRFLCKKADWRYPYRLCWGQRLH